MSDNSAEVKLPKKRGRKPKNVQPSTVTEESTPQVVEKKKEVGSQNQNQQQLKSKYLKKEGESL